MSKPKRVQLSRKRGWKMPPNTVNVARPSMWGNPFPVIPSRTAEWAVRAYRMGLQRRWRALAKLERMNVVDTMSAMAYFARIRRNLSELKDKDLACWCRPGSPCHADVLLELANTPEEVGAAQKEQ